MGPGTASVACSRRHLLDRVLMSLSLTGGRVRLRHTVRVICCERTRAGEQWVAPAFAAVMVWFREGAAAQATVGRSGDSERGGGPDGRQGDRPSERRRSQS